MKVILQQDVRGQGKKGQLVEVSDGYARNFLLPKKLAVIATAENLNTMKQQEKARKAQEAAEKAEAEATAKLREGSNIPIILLTAKSEDSDKILGLNIGADDYITKPFNPLEVIARVKSQLRRYTSLGGADKSPGLLTVGPISLDDSAKQVTVDGEPVALTPIEYNILRLLMTHPGQVFSSAQIYEQVWNDPAYGSENTVAVHIRHLREKIEINPADPRYLKVVWGLGYKIDKGGL